MKIQNPLVLTTALALVCGFTASAQAQTPANPPSTGGGFPPPGGGSFDGPPPFGPGGPGGMMQETKLVKQFDKDGDKRLNNEERQAAREFIKQQQANRGPGGPGGRRGGFGPRGENQEPVKPGQKFSPADVKSFNNAPVYDMTTLRTFFLEFENADWEKELADFNNTDVEVPAKLTVDGKTYRDVGVHFRGASSFMGVSEGRKRSLNVSLDWVNEDQNLGGYRTFNLLNSHEDPTFLRTVLYQHIAREYIPAPKANFVQVVINGESWGVYVSAQQFNKDFVKDWYGTTKGARWKTPGSPQGRAGLNYLGEDAAPYKRIYEIKTKDDPEAWADLIKLCKVLNETPPDQLEKALEPLLEVDGALKFLALENALVNNDGYWVRASDYSLYQDVKGRFHIFPHDANETFSSGGGPGGPGGFGPGMFVAPQILDQADQNDDGKLTQAEFIAMANSWYDKLDSEKAGKVTQEQFSANLDQVLPPPQGFGPPGGGQPTGGQRPGGGRGGFGPAMFPGPGLFTATDANKDGSLTRAEFADTFGKWFAEWDSSKRGELSENNLREGLSAVLPRPNFGGPGGGGPGGPGGGRGRGGFGPGGGGVDLDPLVAAKDTGKPLLSKLLAVPALRARYLGYVREIAEQWLDWNKLGPLAQQYQAVIADAVPADTRKLNATEAFFNGVAGNTNAPTGTGDPGRSQPTSLKSFAEKRRAFLLNHAEVKQAGK